jgi:hypothetical protein
VIISFLDRLIAFFLIPQVEKTPGLWNGPGTTVFDILAWLRRALVALPDVGEPPRGCLEFSGEPLVLAKRLKQLRQWLAGQKGKVPSTGDGLETARGTKSDDEKMKEAKAKLLNEIKRRGPGGPQTKPDALIEAAKVRKTIGRKALRELEKDGNYKGFAKRKSRCQR